MPILNICAKCHSTYEIFRENPLDAEFRELYWCPECIDKIERERQPLFRVRSERTSEAVLDELAKVESTGKRPSLIVMGKDFFVQFAKGDDSFWMGRQIHGVPIFVVDTIDGFAIF